MKSGLRVFFVVLAAVSTMALISCGGGSGGGNDNNGGDNNDDDQGNEVINTTAGQVFPTDLAITSPYETGTQAAGMVVGKADEEPAGFEEDRGEIRDMLAGTTVNDCNFDFMFFREERGQVECYGPTVAYTHYPVGDGNGELPPFDLGIWSEYEGDEACAAAKVNSLFSTMSGYVMGGIKAGAGAVCMLNVNGRDKPAAGDSIDMLSYFQDLLDDMGISGVTLHTVALSRATEDDSDGNAIYDYEFSATLSHEGVDHDIKVYLRHIPLDADNETYKGKFSFVFQMGDDVQSRCSEDYDIDSIIRAGSVLYEKESATKMTYRLQVATFCGTETDGILDDTYDIDPTNTISVDNMKGWANDFNYAVLELDPTDGTGTLAYAWQAGYSDGNTRVFNSTVAADDSGDKSGCSYFGYGKDMAGGEDLGAIEGMICSWAAPGGGGPGGGSHADQLADNPVVQRQCVTYDEDAGVYTSIPADSSHENLALRITYAPVNDCNYAGGEFTFASEAGDMTNDVPDPIDAFDNNLVALPDFTVPTVPHDVY
jgi:hypothetical protein